MTLLRSQVVQAQCPGCHKYLKIPANWIHEPMKCKHCGLVFQAKAPQAPTARPAAPMSHTPAPKHAKPAPLQSRPYAPPPGVPTAAPVARPAGGVPVATPGYPVGQPAVPVARPVNPMAGGIPTAAPVAMPGYPTAAPGGVPTAAPVAMPGVMPAGISAVPTAASIPMGVVGGHKPPAAPLVAPSYRRRSRGGLQKFVFVMVFLLGLGSVGVVIAHLSGVDLSQFGIALNDDTGKDDTQTTTAPATETKRTEGKRTEGGTTRKDLIQPPPVTTRRIPVIDPPPPPPPPPPPKTEREPMPTNKLPKETKVGPKDTRIDTPPPPPPPPDGAVAKGSYPRRLMVVSVNNYPYANPVSYGSGDRSMERVVRQFAKLVKVPEDQLTLLSDKGRFPITMPGVPPVKEVVEQAITQYLDASREQDRVILMFIGHAVEVEDTPYLLPLEGDVKDKATLIPLDWVFQKLATCQAQQKVLILDVCRFDPTRGAERGNVEPMGEKTDAMLQRPPKGVQVLTACVAGQRSLELSDRLTRDGLVDGGIMLNQVPLLDANGGLRGVPQKPDDALPLGELMIKLKSGTSAMATSFLRQPQTPRLTGEVVRSIPFDKSAALPKGITPTLPERFKNGVASSTDLMGVFDRMAKVPPVKQADKGTPFRAESLPPYPKDAVAEYKDDKMETPLRAAIDDAIKALQRSDTEFKIDEIFTAQQDPQLAQTKRQIEAIQKDKVGDAFFQLGKVVEELELRKDDKGKESKYWQAMYDYVLARLYARQAYILEYNVMLGKIRRDDLPQRDPQVHKGWRLASKADVSDKDAKELADKAKKTMEALAKEHKGSPWEVIGKREAITSLGMEWQPY